ncbi:MAG: hypothetical protein WC595_01175 [Candidatus Nanoarchaeia archaeon]
MGRRHSAEEEYYQALRNNDKERIQKALERLLVKDPLAAYGAGKESGNRAVCVHSLENLMKIDLRLGYRIATENREEEVLERHAVNAYIAGRKSRDLETIRVARTFFVRTDPVRAYIMGWGSEDPQMRHEAGRVLVNSDPLTAYGLGNIYADRELIRAAAVRLDSKRSA